MEETIIYKLSEINRAIDVLNSIQVQGIPNILAITDIFSILRSPVISDPDVPSTNK